MAGNCCLFYCRQSNIAGGSFFQMACLLAKSRGCRQFVQFIPIGHWYCLVEPSMITWLVDLAESNLTQFSVLQLCHGSPRTFHLVRDGGTAGSLSWQLIGFQIRKSALPQKLALRPMNPPLFPHNHLQPLTNDKAYPPGPSRPRDGPSSDNKQPPREYPLILQASREQPVSFCSPLLVIALQKV